MSAADKPGSEWYKEVSSEPIKHGLGSAEAQMQQQLYPYSVKLDETQKGIRIAVHVYSATGDNASAEAVRILLETRKRIEAEGLRLAPVEGVKEAAK